jgi:hypothetical protein
MRHSIALFGAVLWGVGDLAWGSAAHAQEKPYLQQSVPAPVHAFELQEGGGYTQGFGLIMPGVGIPSVAGAGVSGYVGLGYRVNPLWSVGVQGEYQQFAGENNELARGFLGNVGVTLHAAPMTRGDPWMRVATGYRGLWSVNPPGMPTTLIHGFEVAKAQFGYDIRLGQAVAIAPVAGIDLNIFVWQDADGTTSRLSSAQVGSFYSVGVNGRFDMLGTTTASTPVATNAR